MAVENLHSDTQKVIVQNLHLVIPPTVWPPYLTGRFIASRILPQYEALIKNNIVMDVGTGSGLIAIMAGKLGAEKVIATDLNAEAVSATKNNWGRNSLPAHKLAVFVSNALEDVPAELEGTINFLISNPPVQPKLQANKSGKMRFSAYDWNEAEKGGRAVLDSVILDGLRFLSPGGTMVTSTSTRHGWNQTQNILDLLKNENRIISWREIHRETHQLAPFYDKYVPEWQRMQSEDNDLRIWKNGQYWFHDFIILEIKKS